MERDLNTAFDDHSGLWHDYQEEPWGRLFYRVLQANLDKHLEGRSLRILDVGGGNGLTAITYAEKGHHVCVLDSSAALLEEGSKLARERGVQDRLEFRHADASMVPMLHPEPAFHVVLCHNVIGYLEDATRAIQNLRIPLFPEGVLSLISMNRYSESIRQILQQSNPKAALEEMDAKTYTSAVFGTKIKLYTAEEMIARLETAGFRILGNYGIRCVIDYLADDRIKHAPEAFAELEALELAMSTQYPYYLQARFFHIIAQSLSNPGE